MKISMGIDKMKAIRAACVRFTGDPFLSEPSECLDYIEDALIVHAHGKIVSVARYDAAVAATLAVSSYPNALVMAGFVDCHVHYPQVQMMGAYGEHLLGWLNTYTFVAEQQFADPRHAETVARLFLQELLRAGTTTAAVYCTVHPTSVDAFFTESHRYNTRMIAGKVLMDRHAPDALLDTAESGYQQSKALLEKWHGTGRQLYAITPRFAASCSEEQLQAAARLWREHPGSYMQTHLCESQDEIDWVKSLFPGHKSYLDVYAQAGLVGPRAIFGHAIHVNEEDLCACHRTGSAIAHCPTSNLFLGSGLFRVFDARNPARPVRVGLGTDVGAGTSLSQLQTLNEAYKVSALNNTKLTAIHAFYLATKGGAQALYLDDRVGNLAAGQEADMVVLDLAATPLMTFRMQFAKTISEKLFALMTLGDDRAIRATYVAGELVYDRDRTEPFVAS